MQNVCKNGSMLLNITQHGRGDLDPEVIRMCKDIGIWLKTNGEAVYGSRPFEVFGDSSVCYTRNNGNVYAALLNWKGGPVVLKALRSSRATLGKVSKVEMIGSDVSLQFVQNDQGLTVTFNGSVPPITGITDQKLGSNIRTLRITHDKGWFNDDDPGVIAKGWLRKCNLGTGDFNNDLTTSSKPGDAWTCSFTGSNISVIAPKEPGAGMIEVKIDGRTRAKVDLSTTGTRQAQMIVYKVTDLTKAKHVISIINSGPGPVAIDGLVIQ
jgi:alpha-L-fucosidase